MKLKRCCGFAVKQYRYKEGKYFPKEMKVSIYHNFLMKKRTLMIDQQVFMSSNNQYTNQHKFQKEEKHKHVEIIQAGKRRLKILLCDYNSIQCIHKKNYM